MIDLGTVDWATVVPSAVAVLALGAAAHSARSSAVSAKASRESNEISRAALALAHRPAVVPFLEPPSYTDDAFSMRVRNIGPGPALNLRGRVAGYVNLRPASAGISVAPSQVGAGEETELRFQPRRGRFTGPDFRVWLHYEDTTGRTYWSSVTLSETSQFDTELGFGPLPSGLRFPRIEQPESRQ